MKRILKKAGILLLVFLLGTAGTALLLNSESTDNRSDFNDAVFPEVMVDMNDTLITPCSPASSAGTCRTSCCPSPATGKART